MPDEEITSTLQALEQALSEGAFGAIDRELETLASQYDAVRSEEAAVERQATATRERVDPVTDGIPDALTTYVKTSAATSIGRAGVLWGTKQYLLDPEEGGAADLREQIGDLREHERTFLEAETEVEEDLETLDIELPPQIVVTEARLPDGPYIPGRSYELTGTVQNVGDQTAEDVTVSVRAPDAVSVESATDDERTLAGGSETSSTFAVEAASPSKYWLEVQADTAGDTVGADANAVQFTVFGADTLSQQALETVQRTRDRLGDSDQERGESRSLDSKLATAEKKIKRGRRQLNEGNDKRAGNQFGAAVQTLGAFLNALDGNGQPVRELSDATRTALDTLARTAIDQLTLAQEA